MQPLTLIVQEVNQTVVTAKTPDGQVWRFPLTAVHGTPKIGQELTLVALAVGAEDAGQSAFAKTLLNEILNSSPS